jgi:hypothetical protein
VVGALGVAADFGTQRPRRGRVLWVAMHGDSHTVAHRGDEGAGVRAIVRASTEDVAILC